jgi:hypothetical protein
VIIFRIYDVRKMMVAKAFISSRFVCGHMPRRQHKIYGIDFKKQGRQCVWYDQGKLPADRLPNHVWCIDFKHSKDAVALVQAVGFVRAHCAAHRKGLLSAFLPGAARVVDLPPDAMHREHEDDETTSVQGDLAGVTLKLWQTSEQPWDKPDRHAKEEPLLQHGDSKDLKTLIRVTVGKRLGSQCPVAGLGMGLHDMVMGQRRLLVVPNPFRVGDANGGGGNRPQAGGKAEGAAVDVVAGTRTAVKLPVAAPPAGTWSMSSVMKPTEEAAGGAAPVAGPPAPADDGGGGSGEQEKRGGGKDNEEQANDCANKAGGEASSTKHAAAEKEVKDTWAVVQVQMVKLKEGKYRGVMAQKAAKAEDKEKKKEEKEKKRKESARKEREKEKSERKKRKEREA